MVRANYQNIKKGIKQESIFLELFFRNLLIGESNELKNRYLIINAPNDLINPSTPPTSSKNQLVTDNDKIIRLIEIIADNHLSVKEMMTAIGLRNRENFMEYSLTPAIKEGFVTMLYPDKPRHPRQKYLLTVKGMAIFVHFDKTS